MRGLERGVHVAAAVLVALALPGCSSDGASESDAPTYPHALMTPTPPKPVPSAALVHGDGRPTAPDLFRGHWTWLYFGYANCPDVCPMAMEYATREYGRLKAPDRVRVVFLSVDPARDRTPKLSQFVQFYHPAFVGVTADKATIDALCQAVGASYVIDAPPKPGATHVMLIGPKKPLPAGSRVDLTLRFSNGATMPIRTAVRPRDGKAAGEHEHHHHH